MLYIYDSLKDRDNNFSTKVCTLNLVTFSCFIVPLDSSVANLEQGN